MRNLKIDCHDGYVIDEENSNLSEGIVKFKKVNENLVILT